MHSRDDRGRDDGAHCDADTPKAIGITLIDTVRDRRIMIDPQCPARFLPFSCTMYELLFL